MTPAARTLTELVQLAHAMACEKGWWPEGPQNPDEIPAKLALIHSEVSEALEQYRDGHMLPYESHSGKPEGFGVELADVLIRVFDLCGYLKIDLDRLVRLKMDYNATRPHRHGGKVV
jgi:NTP pyrophosphatase (non-canonical NTP hydrolase)